MAKLIHNISSNNDSEQYKDNNNIVKYLESHKDRLVDLTEKNFENLVEALTYNAINLRMHIVPILHYHRRSHRNLHSRNPFNQTPTE